MQKSYHWLSLAFLIVAIALRFVMLFSSFSAGAVMFYFAVAVSLATLGVSVFKTKGLSCAFSLEKGQGLSVLALIVAFGFFIDFIRSAYTMIKVFSDDLSVSSTYAVPLALEIIFAILSSVYYIIVSFSYSRGSYDFRLLKLFHFVPLLWIICKSTFALTDVVNISNDVNGIMRLACLGFGVMALYCFVIETISKNGTKTISLFSFSAFSLVCILHFVCSAFSLLQNYKAIFSEDSIFGFVFLFLGVFMLAFSKSIIARTNNI